jgi:hypothetical protein
MASPRFSKLFKHLEEGLFNLGYAKAKAKLMSTDTDGNLIAWADWTDGTSSAGDLQVFVRFKAWEVAGLIWPESMRTQLHAAGQYAEGPALVEITMENPPATVSAAAAKFEADILHVLRGQHGAVVKLKKTNAATNPGAALISSGALVATAATWESTGTDCGTLLPYGRSGAAAPGSLA